MKTATLKRLKARLECYNEASTLLLLYRPKGDPHFQNDPLKGGEFTRLIDEIHNRADKLKMRIVGKESA